MNKKRRIIVGLTGASGPVMGYEVMRALRRHPEVEIHFVSTPGARATLSYESDVSYEELEKLAHVVHDEKNMAASISSGSFRTDGMIVIPCSMKSLAGIVSGYSDNLLLRAADVCLKEGRKVVLVPREMPFGKIHLRNLNQAAELGCTIVPPVLTFYNKADTVQKQIDHIIGKILMQFDLEHDVFCAWEGSDHVDG